MTKVTDDLFDKAINETSFAIPDSPKDGKPRAKKQIALMVEKRKNKKYRDLQKQRRLIKEINEEKNRWKKGDKK